ncbi:MAG TPA: ATP-binding protein [Gemmataceae bacterium]|jgi:SpoVK/Ycf46/Vps4 family AAA+-type ATPase|nr:ATP-binding protein [Gemmataceae bacterium]
MTPINRGIFEEVKEFPDSDARRRFAALVGLDEAKERLLKESQLILNPDALAAWSKKHHGAHLPLIDTLRDRPGLFLFAGDVGTGKTALAESFGDAVARTADIPVTLYSLSLTARGTGAVGEMTSLLSGAFDEVRNAARKAVSRGKVTAAVILLIDEADAIAQSREFAQMHHEDRAGVNAVIRGVDDLAGGRLPALIVMCTNRLDAIDPALRRRAAVTFQFDRPTEEQRAAVLRAALADTGITEPQIQALANATGPTKHLKYGFTYSDLTQRYIPALVFDAFPDKPITFERAREILDKTLPTPPFTNQLD